MKTRPADPCPCTGPSTYGRCCRPAHRGETRPDPPALVRARFAAYAMRKAAYVMRTTDPDGPVFEADTAGWRREILGFSDRSEFVALTIEGARQEGDSATVRFYAQIDAGGRDASFRETSRFRRRDGHWRYVGPVEG